LTSRNIGEDDVVGENDIVGEDEDDIVGEDDIIGDNIVGENHIAPVALEGDSTEITDCTDQELNQPDNVRQSSPGSTLPNEPASIPTVSAIVDDPTVDQQFTLDGPACGQRVTEEEILSGRNIIRCTSTGCETQWVSWGFHNRE
jgi:hypothetical protein